MTSGGTCPRCQQPLVALNVDSQGRQCEACRGVFLPAAELTHAIETPAAATVDSAGLPCPACSGRLHEVHVGELTLDRCDACGGVWFDAGELVQASTAEDLPAVLSKYFVYSLTLPERVVRSSLGMAAGAAREAAAMLVPQAFQSAKTYELVVHNALDFVAENVGGVESQKSSGDNADAKPKDSDQEFLARKAIGNFVDMAGLATLHVSPVWLMAIVSDVAYGTKSYVVELADELQKQGIIDDSSSINHVDDVLEAIQRSTGEAATLFDTPPLDVNQLRDTVDRTRAAITATDYRKVLPEAELKRYWREMRDTAERENQSLLGVSGALSLYMLDKVGVAARGALTSVTVAGSLVNRNILAHYVDGLGDIRRRGFNATVRDVSAPYIQALWKNFEVDRATWTEELVSGRAVKKLFGGISNWWQRRRARAADSQAADSQAADSQAADSQAADSQAADAADGPTLPASE